LKIPEIVLYISKDRLKQAPVISFNIKGFTPGDVGTILDQTFDIKVRTGLHCAPMMHKTIGTFPLGTIRLSPGYFNTAEDIEITIKAIEKIVAQEWHNPFLIQPQLEAQMPEAINNIDKGLGLIETKYYTFGNHPTN